MGRGFEVMIHADLQAKDLATGEAFEDRLAAMDEVTELRRMFGLPDYFIRVQVADAAAYEHWLTTQLLGNPAILRVDSRITMKLVKSGTPPMCSITRPARRHRGSSTSCMTGSGDSPPASPPTPPGGRAP